MGRSILPTPWPWKSSWMVTRESPAVLPGSTASNPADHFVLADAVLHAPLRELF